MAYKLEGLAKEIWEKKYKYTTDNTVEDTWRRVAKAIASVEKDKEYWEEEFYHLLYDFRFIPGGRVTQGAGTPNNYLLNCAVLPIEDSIDGIYEAIKKAAVMAKCNYGIGFDFSSLRPKNTDLSKGGVASGPVSFMRIFDTSGSVIETGGGRRAAAIGVLRVDHPDILEFIEAKRQEGVLTQFNISVGITNKFLEAVKLNSDFELIFEGKVHQTIKAKIIWDKLVSSAYNFNDPGILNLDEVNKYNNGSYAYSIAATNPCFTGDMQILTASGYKSFSSLSGQTVDIINKDGDTSESTIWCSGEKEVVKLKFSNKDITNIKCTPDHIFMLPDGTECAAKDLKGHKLIPFYEIKREFDRIPFMAGFIQGDGATGRLNSTTHKGLEINLGKKDKDVVDFLGAEPKGRTWYSDEAYIVAKKYNLSPEPLPIRDFPTYNWKDSKELADFLSGLWSANGCVIKGARVAFKTTNLNLAVALKELIKDHFWINSYITTNKPTKVRFSNGEYTCKESYDLNISKLADILMFAKYISFVHKYKQNALEDLVKTKAPTVTKIESMGVHKVYDFNEPKTHWGVVEGFVVHNCGEIPLPPYGVCDLGNVNLTKFVKQPFCPVLSGDGLTSDWKMNFDWEGYSYTIKTAVRFLDNVLDVSNYPYPEIADRAKGDRRIGLCTVAGLGSFLAMMQIPYDSELAVSVAECLQEFSTKVAYETSIKLAKEKGAFANFSYTDYIEANFVKQIGVDKIFEAELTETGIRNIALTTIPPVGTGSLIAGNISNGLEPIFALEYNRKVRQADGSKKDEPVEDYAWKLWKKERTDSLEIAPIFFKTSREIAPKDHVKMQAALQKWIDGSISKTVNMPESTTLKEYEEVLWYALESGCKGYTSFREGTREGVLSTSTESKKKETTKHEEKIKATEPKKKRPRILGGNTYKIADDLGNLYITINNIEEKGKVKPFEIFINSNGENSQYAPWYRAMGKLMSAVMRRTDDVSFMVNDLKSIYGQNGYFSDGRYVQSAPQMVGNILEEHIESLNPEHKEVKLSKCPECGNNSYSKEGGCGKCLECGYSQCG